MAFFTHNGGILTSGGAIATTDACCCDETAVDCADLTTLRTALGINQNILELAYGGTYDNASVDPGYVFNVTLSASHDGAPCGNAFWGEIDNPRSILLGANLVGGASWIEFSNDRADLFLYYEHYGLSYDCEATEWVLTGRFGHYVSYATQPAQIQGRTIVIREFGGGIGVLGGPGGGNISADLTIVSLNPFHAIAHFTPGDIAGVGYPMPDFAPIFCGEATIEFTE